MKKIVAHEPVGPSENRDNGICFDVKLASRIIPHNLWDVNTIADYDRKGSCLGGREIPTKPATREVEGGNEVHGT